MAAAKWELELTYAAVALLLAGLTFQAGPPGTSAHPRADPYVIYWPGAGISERKNPTEVGLLYTPEVLAALADRAPESVPQRVHDAIQQQTPIVVLWTIPPKAGDPPWPRPFSAVIVEHGDYSSVPRVEPLWIEQGADEIRRLDHSRSFAEIGVVAAFPRSAFVPGHRVIIYRALPRTDTGMSTGVQRFGLIEWSGSGTRRVPASEK